MNPIASQSTLRPTIPQKEVPVRLRLLPPSAQRGRAAAHFRRLTVVAEIIADVATITLSVIAGYHLYDRLALGKHVFYPAKAVFVVGLALATVMILMLYRAGAYRPGNSLLRVRETEQVLRVSAEAFIVAVTVSFFFSFLFSRWLLAICFGLVPLALFVQKTMIYALVSALHSRGYGIEKVMIYGAGRTGRRVFSVLTRSPKLGLDPIVILDDDGQKAGTVVYEMSYKRRRHAPVVAGPLCRDLLADCGVDSLIIAIPSMPRDRFLQMVEEAGRAGVRVFFVPGHLLVADPFLEYRDIDGILLSSLGKSNRRVMYEGFKRFFDIVVALALLILGAPLFLLAALLVKLDSPGPALFRQERVGEDGRTFPMYKFRTMRMDTPAYDFSPKEASDSRVTRIGKFLRKTSLDECPQLLNVLGGSMSLVGPRPEMPFIVGQYNEWHRQRLQVRPGLTGLWQLSGDRAFLIHENVEYDLYYIQNRNFFMDLAILLHTPIFAMRGI